MSARIASIHAPRELSPPPPTAVVKLKGVIRCRFGVFFEDHAADAEVFITKRSVLLATSRRWLQTDDEVAWKMLSGTRWAFQTAAEVTAQPMTVVNYSTRSVGPANLRVNGAWNPSGYTYAAGGTVDIRWTGRHWRRNGLWQSFDTPFRPVGLEHRVYFYSSSGQEVYWSKVRDAARVELFDGEFQFVASPAAIFGTEPDWFVIRIFSRVRGLLSADCLEARIWKAGSGAAPLASGALCYVPSGLRRVLFATNPEPIMQHNFDLVAARFGLTLPFPAVAGAHARPARNRTQANFAHIATALGIPLHNVRGAGARHPDWVAEANWEALNLAW